MEDPTFTTPDRDAHFEIEIYMNSGSRKVGLQILDNKQNGGHKVGSLESKYN